jgi:hypothetical protein
MSEALTPETQPEATKPESTGLSKIRKIMKISDVRCLHYYGNDFGNGDLRDTHPRAQDIQNAIEDGYFEETPFSDNVEALFNQWCAASNGGADREEFIRVAPRYHAGRVAKLVRDGWTDPIGVHADNSIHDGLHRFLAAVFRGDQEIEVEIG